MFFLNFLYPYVTVREFNNKSDIYSKEIYSVFESPVY